MNFTKNDEPGPNLQRLNFENFEKRRVDLDGSRLWVLRTIQRSWFEIKTQRNLGTSFVEHLGLEIKAELFWEGN